MIQIKWTWVLIPLFVAVIAVQTCALVQRGGRAERAEQAAEAAGMRTEGLIAEQRVTERQLRDALDDADALREQVARAPKGSEVQQLVKWKTREVEVRIDCDGSANVRKGDDSSSPNNTPGPDKSAPDRGVFRFRLDGVQASLKKLGGVSFLVGTVDVIQTFPGPERLFDRLDLKAEATSYLTPPPATRQRRGWGVGPAVGLIDSTWAYGAAATGPVLGKRVGLQPAAWALAGDGHWNAAGAVLISW